MVWTRIRAISHTETYQTIKCQKLDTDYGIT